MRNMFLFSLLLLLLPFAQSQNDRCDKFHSHIYKVKGRYFDCLKLPTHWQMSRCLLQLNTLEKTMRCAGWRSDAALWFDISRNPYAKDLDMVPSLDNYDSAAGRLKYPTWIRHDDNLVRFTPRGLIVAAAEACVDARKCAPPFFNQVLACPHEDMNVFIGCLICYKVQNKDIDNFEEFIRGRQFGQGVYILDIRDKDADNRMQWSKYGGTCHPPLDPHDDGDGNHGHNKVKVKPRAVGDPTATYSFDYTMSTTYPISNGPTPDVTTPSMDQTQTPNKDDEEENTGTAASDVVAGTTTLKRKEAAATTTGASKNDAGGHVVVNVGVFVMVSVFRILL
ncbi:hypothetical protein H9Q74_011092 [Fusarium xylarioides]|nr:hypothetical protein H9Q71_010005 [Fusarium xylarioides]KAG5816491.1 hypothetical protein H9Q74_011092 [Fusarium xylarioides]